MEGTHASVKLVTRIWNMRYLDAAKFIDDPDHEKFTDTEDQRLDFLFQMATIFKEMDNSIRGQRVKMLTGETVNALPRTLVEIVVLIRRLLLKKGYVYVFPGKFSSDRIEAEFAMCQVSRGCNYLIGAKQAINSVILKRYKWYP